MRSLVLFTCALVASLLVIASGAEAWTTDPISSSSDGNKSRTVVAHLADGYTGTAIPEASSADIAFNAEHFPIISFWPSGTGAYSCTVYGDVNIAKTDDDLSDNGVVIGTVTSVSGPLIYANASFDLVWVSCPTNPTDVTVIVKGGGQ